MTDSPKAADGLREALAAIARTTFSGSDMSDDYQRGYRDAHQTCANMARAALASPSIEGQASPQEVQEACAQVADREAGARKRDEEGYGDDAKNAYICGREAAAARRIAASIRALIPPAIEGQAGGGRDAIETCFDCGQREPCDEDCPNHVEPADPTLSPQVCRPEPAAWLSSNGAATSDKPTAEIWHDCGFDVEPLYARPAPVADRAAVIEECAKICDRWIASKNLHEHLAATDIAAAIRSLAPKGDRPATGWQPIETAPKDGTWILVWEIFGTNTKFSPADVGRYHLGEWQNGDKVRLHNASHWMPLPAGPTVSRAERSGGDA